MAVGNLVDGRGQPGRRPYTTNNADYSKLELLQDVLLVAIVALVVLAFVAVVA